MPAVRRSVLGLGAVALLGGALVHRGDPVSGPAAALHRRPTSQPAGQPTRTLSGAYVGSGGAGRALAFGRWRGRAVDFGLDYLDHSSQSSLLAGLDDPGFWVGGYRAAGLPQIVLGVPMIDDARAMTLAAGAGGAYDSHFARLGRALVHGGYPHAILRVGWESNWEGSAQYGGRAPVSWRRYYRRIVAALRSAPGQHFRFDLTAANTAHGWGTMYPGDDVVDIIGVDLYDIGRAPAGSRTGQQRWHDLAALPCGPNHWVRFAAATTGAPQVRSGGRKQLGVGEWAVTGPTGGFGKLAGGDDPDWISAFSSWVRANDVAYESYFDNPGDGQISNNQWPRSAARYRKLFGRGSRI